jgi:tetratricopeptide (TPR) repeat protein
MAQVSGMSGAVRGSASETDATLQWATSAINRGRPDEAERLTRDVLRRLPQHPGALHLLGCALLLQQRPEQALAPLEKAARARQDPEIETQLAIALRQLGRADDALVWLRRATKRRPACSVAFHELGFLLFSLDRSDDAIDVITRGLELMPAMPELLVLLGGIRHARGDRAEAKAAYSRALALAPEHAGGHYGMGAVLLDECDFAPAAEHLQRSLAGNPGDLQARLKLGTCLLEVGRVEDALKCLRAIVQGDPKFYGPVLKLISGCGHGRFWLRPSAAARMLG